MNSGIEFLKLIFEVLQLPILALVVVLCIRATTILRFRQMRYISLAFLSNFLYILFTIFNSTFFLENVFGLTIKITQLEYLAEVFDLLTFIFFSMAFYTLFSFAHDLRDVNHFKVLTSIIEKYKSYVLSFLLVFFMITACLLFYLGDKAVFYVHFSSIYKGFSIGLATLFFLKIKYKSQSSWTSIKYNQTLLVFGLLIWLILQFTTFMPEMMFSQYEYFFFFVSMLCKIFIAISIFTNPLLHEKKQQDEEKEREFQKILETTFHELSSPLSSMALNLSVLAKGDTTKGQKYQELESDFERVQAIVLNAQDAFINVPLSAQIGNTGDVNFNDDFVKPVIINLNRIVQKCVTIVKDQFAGIHSNFNIKIRFGKEVHALGNESEVFQIIINLLKNAIEAYDKDSENKEVNVITGYRSINENDEESKCPYIEISDYAFGIKEKDINSIWERGFSTKVAKDTIKGQGLYIVKNLATRNGIVINMNTTHIDELRSGKRSGTSYKLFFKEY